MESPSERRASEPQLRPTHVSFAHSNWYYICWFDIVFLQTLGIKGLGTMYELRLYPKLLVSRTALPVVDASQGTQCRKPVPILPTKGQRYAQHQSSAQQTYKTCSSAQTSTTLTVLCAAEVNQAAQEQFK